MDMNASRRPVLASLPAPFAKRKAANWGGLAFAFGNLLFLANKLDEMSRLFLGRWRPDVISGQNIGLILLGQIALIIGYVSFYQCYAPRVGRSGTYALRLLCVGGTVLAIGHVSFMSALVNYVPSAVFQYVEPMFFFVFIGLLLLVIGLIWFGVLNLRRPVAKTWPWLPLATGLMGFIGFFLFSGEQINATFLFFRTLFAFGLMALGVMVWLEKPTRADGGEQEFGV